MDVKFQRQKGVQNKNKVRLTCNAKKAMQILCVLRVSETGCCVRTVYVNGMTSAPIDHFPRDALKLPPSPFCPKSGWFHYRGMCRSKCCLGHFLDCVWFSLLFSFRWKECFKRDLNVCIFRFASICLSCLLVFCIHRLAFRQSCSPALFNIVFS